MRLLTLVLGVCPGFGGLIRFGRGTHLMIALSFAFALDIVLFINYQWTSLISAGTSKWTFILLFAFWLFLSALSDSFTRKYDRMEKSDAKGEQFLQTMTSYLKGNWYEAECGAKKLLSRNPRDAEAALLLTTLYRHTHRYLEAMDMLRVLDCLENADRWYYEIYLEKNALQKALTGSSSSSSENENTEAEKEPESEREVVETKSKDIETRVAETRISDKEETDSEEAEYARVLRDEPKPQRQRRPERRVSNQQSYEEGSISKPAVASGIRLRIVRP